MPTSLFRETGLSTSVLCPLYLFHLKQRREPLWVFSQVGVFATFPLSLRQLLVGIYSINSFIVETPVVWEILPSLTWDLSTTFRVEDLVRVTEMTFTFRLPLFLLVPLLQDPSLVRTPTTCSETELKISRQIFTKSGERKRVSCLGTFW